MIFKKWAADHNLGQSTVTWCPYTCAPKRRCMEAKGRTQTILGQKVTCICQLPAVRNIRKRENVWTVTAGRSRWDVLTVDPAASPQQIDALRDVVKTLGMEVRPVKDVPGTQGDLLIICTWDLPMERLNL